MGLIGRTLIPTLYFFILVSSATSGSDLQVLVVYPEAEPAKERIYTEVIDGIKHKVAHVELLKVSAGTKDLQQTMDRSHPDKVIALGKPVALMISNTSYAKQALVGLTHFTATEYNGVSLALDSHALAASVSRFSPFIKRVVVIQHAGLQLITKVTTHSTSTPIIEVREGADMLATVRLLGHFLENEARPTDAVLVAADLPDDMLFEVVKMAWYKHIPLLSTNFSHLENGVLMVFFPNGVALGEQLGSMVNKTGASYEGITVIDAALNRRVAQHLAIDLPPATLDQFALKIK